MVSPTRTAPQDEEDPADHLTRLAEAAAQYDSWGWTAVSVEKRLLLIGDNRVSAIEIDRGLGGEVQHFLAVRLLAGPVIELPGTPARWLFLASDVDEMDAVNFVRIRARGGLVHGSGTFIPMPPSQLPSGEATWRHPPGGATPAVPPFSAVAGALRAVTEGAGLS